MANPLNFIHEVDDLDLAEFVSASGLLTLGNSDTLASQLLAGQIITIADAALFQPISGGENVPDWVEPNEKIHFGAVNGFRLNDRYFLPKLGTLISPSGGVSSATFEEAQFMYTLEKLPYVVQQNGGASFSPPDKIKIIEDAVIFIPWGGVHNYGHFILDALPALLLLSQISVEREWNILTPPLKPWQEELISWVVSKKSGFNITIISDDIVRIKSVLYFDTMRQFLHRGNRVILDELHYVLTGSNKWLQPRRLLIVRKGSKRFCRNQYQVTEAMQALGFEAISPEELSVAEQRELFAEAEVVVGVSGAALANLVFCRPGTRIIEIQPSLGRGIWVRSLCFNLDLAWAPFFVESQPPSVPTYINGKLQTEIGIAFDVPMQPFLQHVTKVLSLI